MLPNMQKESELQKRDGGTGTIGVGSLGGKGYDILKKDFFARLQCVECKGMMDSWNQIVKFDGDEGLQWYLAVREQGWDEI
jgi:hypothetical protein